MREIIPHNQVFLDHFPSDKMLLNDLLQHGRITLAVPRSLRIDDGDRTASTNPQAIGFRPQNASLLAQA